MDKLIYKTKYENLKQKYLTDIDAAFRAGFEQGMKQGQMDAQAQQMQQQQQEMAQQQQMAQQMQGQMPEGQDQQMMEQGQMPEGQDQQMPDQMQGQMPEEIPQASGELDSKIAELEELLGKGEKPKILDLRKAVQELSSLRKQQLSKMNKTSKKAESAQRSLVKGILNKWQEESKSVTEDLEKLLENEGIKL